MICTRHPWYVNESLHVRNLFSLKRLLNSYKDLLTHRVFVAAICLVGCCQIQLMLYSTVGAFIVQDILHQTAIVYGNTALLVGFFYFSGTLTNRFLIKKFHVTHLTQIGLTLLIASSTVEITLALFGKFNLFNLIFPIIMFLISFIAINDLMRLALIYAAVIIIQLIIFYGFYHSKNHDEILE